MKPGTRALLLLLALLAISGCDNAAPPPNASAPLATMDTSADSATQGAASPAQVTATLPSPATQQPQESPSADATQTVVISQAILPPNPEDVKVATPGPWDSDPDLRKGFPVTLDSHVASAQMYPNFTLVGNIDGDPGQEILLTTYDTQPTLTSDPATGATILQPYGPRLLRVWKANGQLAPGWPVRIEGGGAALRVTSILLGNISNQSPGLEVVAPHTVFVSKQLPDNRKALASVADILSYTGLGAILPGWTEHGFSLGPVAAADLNGDGVDEVLALTGGLTTLTSNGSPLQTKGFDGGAVAIADLDGDGKPEVVTKGGKEWISAQHADGTYVDGFSVPKSDTATSQNYYPVVGDVDGDGSPEIIATIRDLNSTQGDELLIISKDGTIKHRAFVKNEYGDALDAVLGDLNCDGSPEIIIETASHIYAFKGDGTPLPGWPKDINTAANELAFGSIMPAIGDVDGDGKPDVVTELVGQVNGNRSDELVAYDQSGKILPHFPKILPLGGPGIMPTIADLDGDGRNEIVISSRKAGTFYGGPDQIWAFDLHAPGPYGPIEWGQFGGGPQRQNAYKPNKRSCHR